MLELNKPIRLDTLFFYLYSKFKEESKRNLRENYSVDLLSIIAKNISRNKNIKPWTEFEKRLNNENKDNRTSKQIEEDVLNKFKKLRQG